MRAYKQAKQALQEFLVPQIREIRSDIRSTCEKSDTIRKLESVGFSSEQARTIANIIQQSYFNSQQNIKEFIYTEIDKLEFRIKAFQVDLLKKFSVIVAIFIGIILTIAKLF